MINLILKICYEDDDVAVIWKQSGIAACNQESKTLELALPFHLKNSTREDVLSHPRFIAQYLDRASSGFLICAKTQSSLDNLRCQLQKCEIETVFRMICHGNVAETLNISIEEPKIIHFDIPGKHSTFHIINLIPQEYGKSSSKITIHYTTHTRNTPSSYITTLSITPNYISQDCSIQNYKNLVRIQLSHVGHPVIGKSRYTKPLKGSRDKNFCVLTKTGFRHPKTCEMISFERDELEKYGVMRDKERKFWERKMDDDEKELKLMMSEIYDDDANQCIPVAYKTNSKVFILIQTVTF
jgi:23S rRNA-/tRNA-specific pseudouridylate synthase